MAFMEPQFTHETFAEVVRGGETIDLVPERYLQDVLSAVRDSEGTLNDVTVTFYEGWAGQLSAPGYHDRTDWTYPNEDFEEAVEDFRMSYCDNSVDTEGNHTCEVCEFCDELLERGEEDCRKELGWRRG